MAKRRKIESESEARRALAAVKASGLSLKEWAGARGIDGRSLHAWKMNLSRGAPTRSRGTATVTTRRTAATQLVELVRAPSTSSPRYVVHVDAASVEFGDDFDAETLRRVVEVLRP